MKGSRTRLRKVLPEREREEAAVPEAIERLISRGPPAGSGLEMSLWPGVSGKTHLPSASGEWANSGYGLYMTSRLSRHGGNFAIASGDACIVLSKSMRKENFSTRLKGTAIRMNLDTK